MLGAGACSAPRHFEPPFMDKTPLVAPDAPVGRGAASVPPAAATIGGLLGAGGLGATAAGFWGLLPAPAWWAGLAVGTAALALAARRWVLPAPAPAAGSPPSPDPTQQRLALLERRARQFDAAEQLVAVGSFDWWPDSGELHWSEQHYRLWGYLPGEVAPSFELFRRHLHPDDAARVESQLRQALAGRGTYDCTHRVQRRDGSVRHVRARGEVFSDAQGRPERMIGAVHDITDRVEAEARLRLHAFVLDALPDPVSAIDAGRRYRLANAAWYEVTGISRRRSTPMHFDHVFPLVINPERRHAIEACIEEGRMQVVRGPHSLRPDAGCILETRYLPFRDPAVDWHGVLMVSRDVSDDEALRRRLTDSVDKLSLTLNNIGDAIFATGAQSLDEPVLFANAQLRSLWNIPPDLQPLTTRVILDHSRRFFRDPAAELARLEAIITGCVAVDDRLQLDDGRVLARRCIPTTQGERAVRIWVFRDITAEARAQRELADAEARQRALLEAFPGYIWVVDADHRIVYLNPLAAAVYDPVVVGPGLPAAELFGAGIYARLRPIVERALAGQSQSFEWQRVRDEPRLPDVLLVRAAPGTGVDGRALCYAFGVDISSLRQAQEALRVAKDEAERANEAKSAFLSAMSHVLRTPLHAVVGFGQMLERNGEGNLSARQLRQIGEIRQAGTHLLALIDDLLDLARIEAGRVPLDPAPVDLGALVDECLPLVQPLAQARGCEILRATPPSLGVLADRRRLKQVLLNLLSNAVEFNRAGGRIWLLAEAVGDRVGIAVRDEGPGLSSAARARLFQPFERLGADAAGIAGTGIGLALSRQMVRAMQGEIVVDSAPGEGCTVRVLLPRADAAAAPAGAQPPAPRAAPATAPGAAAAPTRRLLYVDDNPVNLMLMEGLFEDRPDCALRTLDNAQAALQQLRQAPVDLLLLDLQMPGMDGFECYQRLRADPALQALPVVAVSADANPATIERCRALGFAGYVTKPVDAGRLQAAVDQALATLLH